MFRRILVPIDGSDSGYELAKRGIELAADHDATLHVVYIQQLAPGFTRLGMTVAPYEVSPDHADDEAAALEHVSQQADRHGVTCETTTKRGQRHIAIRNAAADTAADLILLRVPDRRFWRRLPITTVDKVVRQTDRSVLLLDL